MSAQSSAWVKQFSKKYGVDYWFNTETGKSQWTTPNDWQEPPTTTPSTPVESKKRKRDEDMVKVAIIVPFRDLHPEQSRSKHLTQFIPHMSTFLSASEVEFKLYIVEQSNDGRRFNRGKLLNIGFDLAAQEQCTLFIFHDVDLLPSTDLLPYYTTLPSDGPVHIARRWGRYSANMDYFGGVVAFTAAQYRAINGFPNTYWGWGGEDDEMIKRVKEVGFTVSHPDVGEFTDLENMKLDEKLSFLRNHRDWKCMNKWELNEEHGRTWQSNGLHDLQYAVLNTVHKSVVCDVVTVDVKLNGHWSDEKAMLSESSAAK